LFPYSLTIRIIITTKQVSVDANIIIVVNLGVKDYWCEVFMKLLFLDGDGNMVFSDFDHCH